MPKVLVILDGCADRPCKELNNKTPLEAAKTPNLDYFTGNGSLGLVYPVSPKIAPESDTGILSVLGYDIYKYYTGRGPLEAIGAGFKLSGDFIAFRANFSTVINGKLVDRRVGRKLTTKEAKELEDTINKMVRINHKFIFKATSEHRGVLVIRGKFSDNVSNIDPGYVRDKNISVAIEKSSSVIEDCFPLDSKQLSKATAELVNDFVSQSHEILNYHEINQKRIKKNLLPANFITVRDAGIKLPNFPKKNNWAAIVGMPLEKGIAKLTGMDVLSFNYPKLFIRFEKLHAMDCLKTEIKNTIKYLKKTNYPYYYVHIKQTDIEGHDGYPLEKKKMIEILDKRFFKYLKEIRNLELIVTADHSTPSKLKAHSNDPVPLLWYGKKCDDTKRFNEKEARKGSLGSMLGKEILGKLKF